jgi:oligopeptide transport system substrate-binding protein
MRRWTPLLALLLQLLAGCSPPSHKPKRQELRLNLKSEPPTLDPRKATDTTSNAVLNLCFEGLTRMDPEGNPIPAAAVSWTQSEDQLRYVFTLREGYWSDGEKVTAYDFEKSWKTMLDPQFPCEFAADLYIIKHGRAAKLGKCPLNEVGIVALDANTLQIDLEHPVPYFLSCLASHAFFAVPAHVVERNPQWLDQQYVGNGPFLLKERHYHLSITLEKNPFYWDTEHVRLETIFFALIQDDSTELTMFENGELDWAGYPLSNIPSEAIPSLSKTGALHQYEIAGTYCYVFNTTQFPFTNASIRRAFALAINREEIVNNITLMHQTPAMNLVPPLLWKETPHYFQDHDIIEAKRCFAQGLSELGITAAAFPPITLSYNTLSGHHKIAQAIQEQWSKALGIHVKLANKEWKVFLDELRLGQFQVARLGGIASVEDPSTFLDEYRYLSNGKNCAKWSSPRYTALLEEADLVTDQTERFSILRQAEELLIHEMPIVPIYFYTGVYLKQPYVQGVYISKLNQLDLKWAYVDTDD